jgi:acetyl-CoA carboxylase carboxyltransferase component
MVWKPEVDELKRRRELAAQMGGKEGIERQRKRGKLTVRERIDKLSDPNSFQEIGGLAGSGTYEGAKLVEFKPSNMVIGTCAINGRKVVVAGGDFTVRGGASDAAIGDKHGFANHLPLQYRIPYPSTGEPTPSRSCCVPHRWSRSLWVR